MATMKHTVSLITRLCILCLIPWFSSACKDDNADNGGNTPIPQPVSTAEKTGQLSGVIESTSIDAELNTDDSSIEVKKWTGLSTQPVERDSANLSLEAFLLGPEFWTGNPRMITVNHSNKDLNLSLRFGGRLAVDEKLIALPGNRFTAGGKTMVAVSDGVWKTAENVVLPRYDISFTVTSYDEDSGMLNGKIVGHLYNPTNPSADSVPIELELETHPPIPRENAADAEEASDN